MNILFIITFIVLLILVSIFIIRIPIIVAKKRRLKESDVNMVIPYSTDFRNALNASSAAASICFEAQRQRTRGN